MACPLFLSKNGLGHLEHELYVTHYTIFTQGGGRVGGVRLAAGPLGNLAGDISLRVGTPEYDL